MNNRLFDRILNESQERFVVLGPYDDDGCEVAGTVDSMEKAFKLGRLFLTGMGYCSEDDFREPEEMGNGDWLMTDEDFEDFDCDGHSGAYVTILSLRGDGRYAAIEDDGDCFSIVDGRAFESTDAAEEAIQMHDEDAEYDEDEDIWTSEGTYYEVVCINKVMQEMV